MAQPDNPQLTGLTPQMLAQINALQQQQAAQQRATQLQGFYDRNQAYAKQGDYQTQLPPEQEKAFQAWVEQNKVPFDSAQKVQDYDMRGFYQALQNKDPKAVSGIDPNDQQIHYPDYWKTPYHESFSNESQWATEGAPKWNDKDQLVDKSGKVIFDDKAKKKEGE